MWMHWYVPKCAFNVNFPFGLRSAPKIFNAIADALEWIAKSCGVTYLEHFLDDYVTVGAPGTSECNQNLPHTQPSSG